MSATATSPFAFVHLLFQRERDSSAAETALLRFLVHRIRSGR